MEEKGVGAKEEEEEGREGNVEMGRVPTAHGQGERKQEKNKKGRKGMGSREKRDNSRGGRRGRGKRES